MFGYVLMLDAYIYNTVMFSYETDAIKHDPKRILETEIFHWQT